MTDPHVFENASLGFALRKPETWEFMPPAWAPSVRLRNSGDPDWSWITPNQPFCVARCLHESQEHAFPTLQVAARAVTVPTEGQAQALLAMQLQMLNKHYGQFDVRDARTDLMIDGHPAIVIVGSANVKLPVNDGHREFGILSRLRIIFAPGRAFTVGMSSSTDEEYYFESDFDSIAESIRIGS